MARCSCGKMLADYLTRRQLNIGCARARAAGVEPMRIDRHVCAAFYAYGSMKSKPISHDEIMAIAREQREHAGETGASLRRYIPYRQAAVADYVSRSASYPQSILRMASRVLRGLICRK